MPRPHRLLPVLLACAATLPACKKEEATEAPVAKAPKTDNVEFLMRELVKQLGEKGTYSGVLGIAGPPLSDDLSAEAYHDLHESISFLGAVDEVNLLESNPIQGGEERKYQLFFTNGGGGEVLLDITAQEGMLRGFHFEGKGFVDAEHEAIAEQYRVFKVYDFKYKLEDGSENPDGEVYATQRIDWEIFVGGIEALGGEHHIKVSKRCVDDGGREVFREPIEYDVKFDANAEGIPTGHVDGYVEVPGPGQYELKITLTDENSMVSTEHVVPVEVRKP